LESLGVLAGGIAHDFNNLLTVVQMQTSLLLDERRLDPHAEQGVRQIMDAANRAANLTRQLLAFSRQQVKQALALDLAAVVASTTKLLRRVLGEHISLESRFASNLPCVHADPGMMEQVLMNLVINARDAMPDGGSLVISLDLVHIDGSHVAGQPTARVGRFVQLTVTDTGSGIAPEVLPRIFDPFFTTKEVGKGTGLGLATVFGIVQHHHGWIEIETAVGRGSSFRVYLPPLEKPADQARTARPEPAPGGGSETVLLVEDEPAVASVAARALSRRGYNVIKAGSAAEAIRVWDEHFGKVDLLLTDLVMPGGVSGLKLAEELRQRSPALKVIYTSGYSSATVSGGHEFEAGRNFLPKPYPLDELTTIVRQRLDER
jgi:CheY-like chemotaxis protein